MEKAYNQIIKPGLDKISKSLKDLERCTKNNFLKIKVTEKRTIPFFPIKYYQEKELETMIICNNCGLEFAIYGIFARCPDCNQLNVFIIYFKSIEVTEKQLELFDVNNLSVDLKEQNLKFLLVNSISAFDALGKELRRRQSNSFPNNPKNLFQNLQKTDDVLNNKISSNINIKNFNFLLKMFQVRHIYEHNMGIIDDDFIKKLPEYKSM